MKKVDYLILFLVALLFSIVAGKLVGDVSPSDRSEQPLILTLSLNTNKKGSNVKVKAYQASLKKATWVKSKTDIAQNAVLVFVLPKFTQLDSLSIEIAEKEKIHFNGLTISSGNTVRSFSSENLKNYFSWNSNCANRKGNQLEFCANEQGLLLKSKSPIVFQPQIFSYPWAIAAFVFVLFGCLIWMKLGSISLGRMLVASLVAIGFGMLTVFFLLRLKEEVKNADVELTAFSTQSNPPGITLRCSSNGSFDTTIVRPKISEKVETHKLKFQLNHGANVHTRIDFPLNDTIQLKELKIAGWLKEWEWDDEALLKMFPLINDGFFQKDRTGETVFITGNFNPYLQMADEDFQKEFTLMQKKKNNYPVLLGLVVFLVALVVFSRSYPIKKSIFALSFSVFLLIPSITFFLKQDKVTLESEKRDAHQKPIFTGNLGKLTSETSNYLDDQYGGRTRMITTWNILKVRIFNQTNHTSPVVMGEDNWMFYVADGVQEVYENKNLYSEDILKKMLAVVEERREWLALQGIEYYLTFPPIKPTMYEEYLPSRIRRWNTISKLDQVIDYLRKHSKVTIIDLRPKLFEGKKKETQPIYYKYDTHWNLLGGFYGYSAIMDSILLDHPELGHAKKRSDYIWSESTSTDGDLAKMISLDKVFLRSEIVPVPKNGFKAQLVPSEYYPTHDGLQAVVTNEQKDSKLPKMVMNRDSFANFLIPFLSEHFSRSVYLWTPNFDADVIRKEKPDLVITEMLERFTLNLMIENPSSMKDDIRRWRIKK